MPIEYDQLEKTAANYVPLTPVSFLNRTADIYPNREALIYNDKSWTWGEVRERCRRVASALNKRGLGKNDTVSLLTFNTPEMFECHYAVPMAGAVLNTINTRLDAGTIAYIIDHGEAKLFVVDRELWPIVKEALTTCKGRPEIIIVDDWGLPPHARYLYTVPMFHCNGWCHVWTMTLVAGTITAKACALP